MEAVVRTQIELFRQNKGALSHSVAKLTRFCMPIEENRKKRFGKVKRMGRSRHTKNFMGANQDCSS